MPRRISLEQERAAKALVLVKAVHELPNSEKNVKKKYRSYVKSASMLILTNGLTQTLAFWQANTKPEAASSKAYQRLLDNLSELVLGKENGEIQDMLERELAYEEMSKYRQDTSEALACLVWLKRFADAYLPEETEGA